MTKWFIDDNSVIRPVYNGDEYIGDSSDLVHYRVNYRESKVYEVDFENFIQGEYTLWNSLTELARVIEAD